MFNRTTVRYISDYFHGTCPFQFQITFLKMEAELTLNHYSTDYSNIFNSTTEFTIEEGTFKWTDAEIARLIQIIVRPIFLTVGTTGNGLTFYIMRRTSLKNVSSCF